ncbi:hypothetical protein PY254_03600 [Rhodanobacter sp. AS-Z3]|uniref:hypothetical protein n=1 Tax=Rhodanobacter sp. AS-Z3 TaxID=3031330 RepID=UPI00247963A6|nr:hypothetical protein [Rhodanobacter sp. AS-Z3]WEN15769.1 hypothetical protein PY254_03600 [Rhodanobacter sp. AS-Z3]
MTRPFRLRYVARRRLIWLVALLLLWQQVALAAYVCQAVPETMGQVTAMAAAPAMAAMDGHCADMSDAAVSPLCHQHCAPDHATQVDARPTSVPLSALTAVPPMLMSVAVVALQSDRSLAQLDQRRPSPPVPRLLFCSLLV